MKGTATSSASVTMPAEINLNLNSDKQTEINPPENPKPQQLIPKLGMEFDSEQSAYDFYNLYAFKTGFGIRRSWKHSLKNSTECKDRTFCCTRQGFSQRNLNNYKNNNKDHIRAETRCNCQARIKIVLTNGVYKVYEFNSQHNHELLKNPNQVKTLRSHRHVEKSRIKNERFSKVLDRKRASEEGWDPVRGYKDLCAMFIKVAELAAQTEESFEYAVGCKDRIVQDLKMLLKRRDCEKNNKRVFGEEGEMSREKRPKPDILAELEGSSDGQWQLSDSSNESETEDNQI